MTHRKLILLAFLLPTLAFGQKKYKFKYREHLTSQLSTFKTELEDTLLAADKCNLTFLISDNKGEAVPFANVKIKSSVIDCLFVLFCFYWTSFLFFMLNYLIIINFLSIIEFH